MRTSRGKTPQRMRRRAGIAAGMLACMYLLCMAAFPGRKDGGSAGNGTDDGVGRVVDSLVAATFAPGTAVTHLGKDYPLAGNRELRDKIKALETRVAVYGAMPDSLMSDAGRVRLLRDTRRLDSLRTELASAGEGTTGSARRIAVEEPDGTRYTAFLKTDGEGRSSLVEIMKENP